MNGIVDREVGHEEKEWLVLVVIDVFGRQFRQALGDLLASIQTGNFLGVVESPPAQVGIHGMGNMKIKAMFGWTGVPAQVPLTKQCGGVTFLLQDLSQGVLLGIQSHGFVRV